MAKCNYNYGKIVDGVLKFAPNKLVVEQGGKRVQIFNAPQEIYAAQGWLPIIGCEMPAADEGGYYSPNYTHEGDKIFRGWEFVAFEEEVHE